MSSRQDGYDKGYEDGLNDRSSFTEGMQGFLGTIIDTALSVTEAEEEWRSGYQEGYEAGQREREENQ